ncbi:MAG: response regulator [Candidatus Paceibacterota bacterium]|jgi:CheY-like chemotaxis protein
MPNKKILIIDDDKFLLDMYAMKFSGKDFDIETSQNASDSLSNIVGGYHPDVILLDLVMPGMDGFGFLEEMKKKNLANGTKIIVFSNLGQKDDIEKGMALGAAGYIIKASSTPSEVVQKVNQILGK